VWFKNRRAKCRQQQQQSNGQSSPPQEGVAGAEALEASGTPWLYSPAPPPHAGVAIAPDPTQPDPRVHLEPRLRVPFRTSCHLDPPACARHLPHVLSLSATGRSSPIMRLVHGGALSQSPRRWA
ncbi:hypothetical protein AAFF_G00237530, partial [Aldrovandia affinis]